MENFSERENARFNKGITLAQVDEVLALLDKWKRAYPGALKPFKGGGEKVDLGFILFTPWTTLKDVSINMECAKERHFLEKGYWLYSTLRILPDAPLHCLAKKEGGILADSFPDRGQFYGTFHNTGDYPDAVPWRFKDPKTADYFAMVVRVCAAALEEDDCAFFRKDPDFALARRLYAEANERARVSPLAIAFALLDLMEAARPPYSREALLREAVSRASG
ncbi:MAG: hypothetical protein HY748_06555 [Elusimicrobia bacterium]|nr:hypothetical protein [Elusimicrobiota bacterium]